MVRFYIADVVGDGGRVRIQGDTSISTVTIKDSFVDMTVGRRVLLSDLGQDSNQYVAVRNVYSGAVPFPPQADPLSPTVVTIPSPRSNSTFTAAWAKTIRYDLRYYDPVIPGITGTAYSTLVLRPNDFRELLPYSAIAILPSAIRANLHSFTNLVVGGDYAHPLRIRARNLGDPTRFSPYARFPPRAHRGGVADDPVWEDPLAEQFGLRGMLPHTAAPNLSLIHI